MLEAATEGMLSRIADVKATIAGLIAKLENDPYLNWDEFKFISQIHCHFHSSGGPTLVQKISPSKAPLKNPFKTPLRTAMLC